MQVNRIKVVIRVYKSFSDNMIVIVNLLISSH